jgi:acetoin utilization deacetylase AcuC-like enzyme
MKIYYSDKHKGHAFGLPDSRPADYDSNYEHPGRVDSILKALKSTSWAEILPPDDFGLEPILQVHTARYLDYLKDAYKQWMKFSVEKDMAFIPYKPGFKPTSTRFDKVPDQDGFFMTDMYVPVNEHTYPAAIAAANCALSASRIIATQKGVAFALCRPPGHHAGVEICGGFCYLNNAAIAAQWLSSHGKVAILDIDYHTGNGTQSIFYERADVLTISLHADPVWEYPSFAGFAHETGSGAGKGFHHNFPLPHQTDDSLYLKTLDKALQLIITYSPNFLVVSAGFDTFKGDPLGDFTLSRNGFPRIGGAISTLQIPTVIMLEGGYKTDELGDNVVAFLGSFNS